MAQRLTDRIAPSLSLPAKGNRIYYDDKVRGFGLRVTAAGARAFVFNYRRRSDGLERRVTIGGFPEWTVATAREEAKRLRREIDAGSDPVGQRREERAAATVADLCDRFESEYVPRKRPPTQRNYRSQIATDIRPALGRMKVASVTFRDIDALHRRISQRAPIVANRIHALLSKLFSLAIRWGMRPDNPCRGIEHNPENKRQRYLTGAELARLTVALAELRDRDAADAIRLLLLTGCRKGELLAARWSDFDLAAGIWTKPAASTKQKAVHRVPLSTAARELLTEMRGRAAANAEWVFPAPLKPGHRTAIDAPWRDLRIAAGLPDVRLHDLRHSYASILASQGLSLPIIGALLGHTQASTTHRYAHLVDDAMRVATERAADVIAGRPSAEIVAMKDRRS